MQTEDKLPPELTWEADGHLTEVALTLLADGEAALLDEGAAPHVAGCEACSARLGAAALVALRVGEELPAIAARAPLAAAAMEGTRAPLAAAAMEGTRAPLAAAAMEGTRAANDALARGEERAYGEERAHGEERASAGPLEAASGVRALPLRAIAAALLVAAVGAVPSLAAGAEELPELLMTLIRGLVMIGRTVAGVAQGSARDALLVAPALSWLSAGLLVLSGLAVARGTSRRRVLQEGGM